jgi:pyrroline-5-carboxylate reductase
MAITETLGVIGGGGWLGGALIRGAVNAGVVEPARLHISSRSGHRGSIADIAAHWTHDNAELIGRSDAVILSVRPEQFRAIHLDLAGKLVLSVMAGVRSAEIAERTGAQRIVRALPNAAAAIRQSFSPWFAGASVSERDKCLVHEFLAASGEAVETPDEFHIDCCGALSGSGAAYPALLAEALTAAAVSQGLSRAFAERAAKSLLCNATQLFAGEQGSPAAIVQEMIDYRGMIAAALQTMMDKGFMESVSAGLEAAMARS